MKELYCHSCKSKTFNFSCSSTHLRYSRGNLAYTSSIDHSQAAAPFVPLHLLCPPPPSVLRPSFRVLRPPISDLRPLYLNLISYRLHLSLPPGIRHRDIWYIFFGEYLYLSPYIVKIQLYTYKIYLNIENPSKHWFRNQNTDLYNNKI